MFWAGRLSTDGPHLTTYRQPHGGFDGGRRQRFADALQEVTTMKSDGPLILAVLCVASGLTMIFYYGVGTAGFNAAYPFSAASLNLSIAATGPAAIGGLGLTALGVLLLVWALICAMVGEFSGIGTPSPERMERKRLEQQQKLEKAERKRLEQQERLMKQEERLRASYPRD
jgi:hypothetical protein